MNKETQRALDIAKEALFLIRASDPAYNAKTTYRVVNHERFGELLREFLEVEERIRQAHTEQKLNIHSVMRAEGSAFDCSKYNKREGQGCDLNNNCRYPNCAQGASEGVLH
jgi:hypothetical protein